MKRRFATSPFAVLLGWFLILIAAAVVLPCVSEAWSLTAKAVFLALLAGWLTLMATSLARYLYRSWRRVSLVENPLACSLWLSGLTIGSLGISGYLVWIFVLMPKPYVTSMREARERILQQDLFEMRSLINQYTIERHRPLRSLNELVNAGYLRSVPVDPMTGRNDTWVVIKCPDGKSEGGIVDVESGSTTRSKKSPPCD